MLATSPPFLTLCAVLSISAAFAHVPCHRVDGRIVVHASSGEGLDVSLNSLLVVDFGRGCVRVVVRVRIHDDGSKFDDSVAAAFSDFCVQYGASRRWVFELERTRQSLWSELMWDGVADGSCVILDSNDGPPSPDMYSWLGRARDAYGARGDVIAFSISAELEIPISPQSTPFEMPFEETFFARFFGTRPKLFSPVPARWRELLATTSGASVGEQLPGSRSGIYGSNTRIEDWLGSLRSFVEQRDLHVVHAPRHIPLSKFPAQPDIFNRFGNLVTDNTQHCRRAAEITTDILPTAERRYRCARTGDGLFNNSQYNSAVKLEVCVVLTAYNNANTLRMSLLSILGQSHTNVTVVAVDDASSDGTACLVHDASVIHSRVRPLLLEARSPGGVGHSANVGRGNCPKSARYVAFLDADDVMEPNALQQLATLAATLDLDVAIGDFVRVTSTFSRVLAPAYDRHVTKTLPRNFLMNPVATPELFRLSPVPWRKLYDMRFLESQDLRFPEGDFFFEDNTFHWDVLLHANRVAYIDKTIIKHVVGGERQTTAYLSDSGHATALSGFFANLRIIQSLLLQHKTSHRITTTFKTDAVSEFITFMSRSKWVARMQPTLLLRKKFGRVLVRLVEAFIDMSNSNSLRYLLESNRLIDFRARPPPKPQLSVVVPCRNAHPSLSPLLVKLLGVSDRDVNIEVFVVDDGLDVNSLELVAAIAKSALTGNVYVLNSATSGAGKARNSALPLLEGDFTLFVDADDDVNIDALIEVLRFTQNKQDGDLVFIPYEINTPGAVRDMWQSDRSAFIDVTESGSQADASQYQRRAFLKSLSLTNYPWNRFTRTELLHNHDIYFGSTAVHNDVRFHWTTIAAAKGKIAFYDAGIPLITHAKDIHPTLTSIVDATRTQVFDALEETRRALNPDFFADADATQAWRTFTIKLTKWAAPRINFRLHHKARNQCMHALVFESDTFENKQRARTLCTSSFPFGSESDQETSYAVNASFETGKSCTVRPPTAPAEMVDTRLNTRHEKRHARRSKRAEMRRTKRLRAQA